MCYHVKFGCFASKGVRINRRESQKLESAGAASPPLCSGGVADGWIGIGTAFQLRYGRYSIIFTSFHTSLRLFAVNFGLNLQYNRKGPTGRR